MAKRKVTTIPATINKFTAKPVDSKKKRKVAGYARVSTDHEDQLTSYEAQVDYYTNYIKGRDDWEFAGLYSDEGISATNTKHRDGFNQMVTDALAGKIDLIITKSVSRFARNTVDSLSTIRKLKEHNIECYFEKENIWTFDSKGELLLICLFIRRVSMPYKAACFTAFFTALSTSHQYLTIFGFASRHISTSGCSSSSSSPISRAPIDFNAPRADGHVYPHV